MEEEKLNTNQIIFGVVALVVLVVAGIFLYIQSKNQVPVEENIGLTSEEMAAIEARINSAPVDELTSEEKAAIEERINSAPSVELTPEEKAAIEERINQ